MESYTGPLDALATAERATASVWTDYPPTPAWYYPAVGAWEAALVYTTTGIDSSAVQVPLLLALLALAGGFAAWYRRYRGALPKLTSAPPEFRRAIRTFFCVYAAVIAGAFAVGFALDLPLAAAAGTFAAATAGLYVYEKAYESAVRRTRDRLG